ncbi:hypothetical protein [Paraburkholderia sp. C35]|uniref:hypothetical protein n=1 Tax=Paraburkholderia sp. C35 TaxID=2126993 RepID=UPI000D69DF1B|nr:hypothetical protein [Paraburkholderia sp. C35]
MLIIKQQNLHFRARRIAFAGLALLLIGISSAASAQNEKPRIGSTSERLAQINRQVNRLVSVISDEYAEEFLDARRVRLVDVPNYGAIALATFTIESFSSGNNSHQFLAIFGPPDEPEGRQVWPYYSLTALSEVGDGCDVHVEAAQVQYVRNRGLKLAIPNSTSRFCTEHQISFLLRLVGEASKLKQLCRTDASGRCE